MNTLCFLNLGFVGSVYLLLGFVYPEAAGQLFKTFIIALPLAIGGVAVGNVTYLCFFHGLSKRKQMIHMLLLPIAILVLAYSSNFLRENGPTLLEQLEIAERKLKLERIE